MSWPTVRSYTALSDANVGGVVSIHPTQPRRIFTNRVVTTAPVLLFVKVTLALKSCTPFSILLVIIPSITSFVASYTRPLGRL